MVTSRAGLLLLGALACQSAPQAPRSTQTIPTPPKSTPEAKSPSKRVQQMSREELLKRFEERMSVWAEALAKRYLITDGHIDVPYRLEDSKKDGKLTEDVSQKTPKGDFDYPRAMQGGLNAPFMSIYVPAKFQKTGGAKKVADGLITMVEGIAKASPDKFAIPKSVEDVREHYRAGKISLPMGIENGAAIEKSLRNVRHFHGRGVRYITLTHSEDNQICDSSYAESRTWKGLSPFGKRVVQEMNKVGIMVDISHVSDDTFWQVMKLTKVPVIASHSSCRHFTPDFERNMSDDMIRALAENGGVIMINFGSSFISQKSNEHGSKRWAAVKGFMKAQKIDARSDARVEAFVKDYDQKNPRVYASVEDVADHIDHVAEMVGVEHVGLGSDFDGVGDSLPTGLKDVSFYPNLIKVLLMRGYNEDDIEKICSGNLLRVWSAVEKYAKR